jgi:NIMA (never in mitosis gene a)-related kinase
LHRDIKAANIFKTTEGVYKLGDLNVSKVLKNSMAKTQTGTPYYVSPEIWKDKPYGVKSDIWSLGCVIYEMASLRPPFLGNDLQSLYKNVVKGIYPRIPVQYS